MKAKYVNPFLTAFIEVMQQFIDDLEIERGEPSVAEAPFTSRGAAVYIGISGDLEGRVIYDMSRVTAVELASAMTEESLPGLNEMVRSTIQELAKRISGNVGTKLGEVDGPIAIDITPPSLIVGADAEISDSISSEFLKVPLETNYGTVEVNMAVRET